MGHRNKREKEEYCVEIRQDWWPKGTQEEGIDYDEVFAPVARIEAIRVYVSPPPGFVDLLPKERFIRWSQLCMDCISSKSMDKEDTHAGYKFQIDKAGIFISQDKYVAEILKKFDLVNVKTTITPMETKSALTKGKMKLLMVDGHSPRLSHLNAVKRIFKYLKGKPHLGLWYPRESPFDLEAFSDSDYGGSNLDRKSTIGFAEIVDFLRGSNLRIDGLEKDLKQTKLTMGSAIVKLVKKVKKLEGILKRKMVVFSDSEEEEPEDQGRKSQDDPLVSLVQGLVTPSKTTVNILGEEQVEDISPNTLEAAKTLSRVASQKLNFHRLSKEVQRVRKIQRERRFSQAWISRKKLITECLKELIREVGQREGKAPMIIEEAPKKTKEQILQEEASLAEAIRLDTLEKEEKAKQVHLDSLLAQRIAEEEEMNEQQKKRRAQVQFEA
ncbi:hypothetical protein Tco_0040306 [Tanacetum coccineum]